MLPDDSSADRASEPLLNYDEINLITKNVRIGMKSDTQPQRLHFDYIMGNPPFVGYSLQSREQKEDLLSVFVDEIGKPYKGTGKMDYVAGWFYKTAQILAATRHTDRPTKAALVATNSIAQGEQVAAIWRPLQQRFGIHIHFAHRSFRWDSESSQKAHVHCVIVGLSAIDEPGEEKVIFEDSRPLPATNINGYLMEADDVFVESRNAPLCQVPLMTTGNRPADGGHLIIEEEDYDTFIATEPEAEPYIRRFIGSAEFINNRKRYCLWLKDVSPAVLRKMPLVMQRIKDCRDDRLASPDPGRRKLALTPHLFRETYNPDAFVAIPKVSSSRRHILPMGFLSKEYIASDLLFIIPDASLYHFGILTSSVHMAWMRTVCGRLKSDYRYSKDIVYNNFPWPTPTTEQMERISLTARNILRVREKYPDASLADLYDDLTMPLELRKAHDENDRAVMQAYGFDARTTTHSQCVARLFKMYQQLLQPTI